MCELQQSLLNGDVIIWQFYWMQVSNLTSTTLSIIIVQSVLQHQLHENINTGYSQQTAIVIKSYYHLLQPY